MENSNLEQLLQQLTTTVAKTFRLSTMDAVGIVANSSVANEAMRNPHSIKSLKSETDKLLTEIRAAGPAISPVAHP